MKTAANIDAGWVDFDAAAAHQRPRSDARSIVINDADAAGMAELAYGEARGRAGHGHPADGRARASGARSSATAGSCPTRSSGTSSMRTEGRRDARQRRRAGPTRPRLEALGTRVQPYLAQLELYFWPDLIILGGGVSKESARYGRYLVTRAPIVNAHVPEHVRASSARPTRRGCATSRDSRRRGRRPVPVPAWVRQTDARGRRV